jgi:hypothetical protein
LHRFQPQIESPFGALPKTTFEAIIQSDAFPVHDRNDERTATSAGRHWQVFEGSIPSSHSAELCREKFNYKQQLTFWHVLHKQG